MTKPTATAKTRRKVTPEDIKKIDDAIEYVKTIPINSQFDLSSPSDHMVVVSLDGTWNAPNHTDSDIAPSNVYQLYKKIDTSSGQVHPLYVNGIGSGGNLTKLLAA